MNSDPADWWKDEPEPSELERAILRDKMRALKGSPPDIDLAKLSELMMRMVDAPPPSDESRPSHAALQQWFLSMEQAKPDADGFVRFYRLSDGRLLRVTLEVGERGNEDG